LRIVVALGGNALLERGDRPDAVIQLRHVRTAANALAPLAQRHEMLVCHGNGPQVGLLALESETDTSLTSPYPLDALVAQTQGMLGYWLAQGLHNAGVTKPIVSIVTQTVVALSDPGFATATKFIGPGYARDEAGRLAELHGWAIAQDGDRWRRVVPSPEPQRLVEQDSITAMLLSGAAVICGGGGGAPVAVDDRGQITGVEAVVDKDLTSALLAIAVDADRLLVLTDVSAVQAGFGTPEARPLHHIDLAELAEMTFPPGSMGPKIEACRRFVAATSRPAAIGSLTEASALVTGEAGTTITRVGADVRGSP
jgi:carbamate kinase